MNLLKQFYSRSVDLIFSSNTQAQVRSPAVCKLLPPILEQVCVLTAVIFVEPILEFDVINLQGQVIILDLRLILRMGFRDKLRLFVMRTIRSYARI